MMRGDFSRGSAEAMSMHSTRIGLRSAVIALSAALGVLVLAAVLVPSASLAADNHTMNIRGYVFDNHGNKIADAQVTVTMYRGATPGVSHSTTSSSSPKGWFNVNFVEGEWATGDTVLVVAQYQGGAQGTNHTLAVDGANFFEYENVTLPYEIPQFGSTAGLLVTAGIIGVVASVVLVWKRTK